MQSPAVMVLEAKRALPCVDLPMESAEEISAPDLRSSHGKKSADSERPRATESQSRTTAEE